MPGCIWKRALGLAEAGEYHFIDGDRKLFIEMIVLGQISHADFPYLRHICAFSRGVLNVRSTRSHSTLAPRPPICLIEGNGFCAVAGEGELNRRRGLGDRS